jgi:hypothetical protein
MYIYMYIQNANKLAGWINMNPKSCWLLVPARHLSGIFRGEPSMSAPNDFRPNRAMKRSTRTSKVVRRHQAASVGWNDQPYNMS